MEVGRSVSGGFSDTEQQRGSKFRAQSSGYEPPHRCGKSVSPMVEIYATL